MGRVEDKRGYRANSQQSELSDFTPGGFSTAVETKNKFIQFPGMKKTTKFYLMKASDHMIVNTPNPLMYSVGRL